MSDTPADPGALGGRRARLLAAKAAEGNAQLDRFGEFVSGLSADQLTREINNRLRRLKFDPNGPTSNLFLELALLVARANDMDAASSNESTFENLNGLLRNSYQHTVLRGPNFEEWPNAIASLIAAPLLATKVIVPSVPLPIIRLAAPILLSDEMQHYFERLNEAERSSRVLRNFGLGLPSALVALNVVERLLVGYQLANIAQFRNALLPIADQWTTFSQAQSFVFGPRSIQPGQPFVVRPPVIEWSDFVNGYETPSRRLLPGVRRAGVVAERLESAQHATLIRMRAAPTSYMGDPPLELWRAFVAAIDWKEATASQRGLLEVVAGELGSDELRAVEQRLRGGFPLPLLSRQMAIRRLDSARQLKPSTAAANASNKAAEAAAGRAQLALDTSDEAVQAVEPNVGRVYYARDEQQVLLVLGTTTVSVSEGDSDSSEAGESPRVRVARFRIASDGRAVSVAHDDPVAGPPTSPKRFGLRIPGRVNRDLQHEWVFLGEVDASILEHDIRSLTFGAPLTEELLNQLPRGASTPYFADAIDTDHTLSRAQLVDWANDHANIVFRIPTTVKQSTFAGGNYDWVVLSAPRLHSSQVNEFPCDVALRTGDGEYYLTPRQTEDSESSVSRAVELASAYDRYTAPGVVGVARLDNPIGVVIEAVLGRSVMPVSGAGPLPLANATFIRSADNQRVQTTAGYARSNAVRRMRTLSDKDAEDRLRALLPELPNAHTLTRRNAQLNVLFAAAAVVDARRPLSDAPKSDISALLTALASEPLTRELQAVRVADSVEAVLIAFPKVAASVERALATEGASCIVRRLEEMGADGADALVLFNAAAINARTRAQELRRVSSFDIPRSKSIHEWLTVLYGAPGSDRRRVLGLNSCWLIDEATARIIMTTANRLNPRPYGHVSNGAIHLWAAVSHALASTERNEFDWEVLERTVVALANNNIAQAIAMLTDGTDNAQFPLNQSVRDRYFNAVTASRRLRPWAVAAQEDRDSALIGTDPARAVASAREHGRQMWFDLKEPRADIVVAVDEIKMYHRARTDRETGKRIVTTRPVVVLQRYVLREGGTRALPVAEAGEYDRFGASPKPLGPTAPEFVGEIESEDRRYVPVAPLPDGPMDRGYRFSESAADAALDPNGPRLVGAVQNVADISLEDQGRWALEHDGVWYRTGAQTAVLVVASPSTDKVRVSLRLHTIEERPETPTKPAGFYLVPEPIVTGAGQAGRGGSIPVGVAGLRSTLAPPNRSDADQPGPTGAGALGRVDRPTEYVREAFLGPSIHTVQPGQPLPTLSTSVRTGRNRSEIHDVPKAEIVSSRVEVDAPPAPAHTPPERPWVRSNGPPDGGHELPPAGEPPSKPPQPTSPAVPVSATSPGAGLPGAAEPTGKTTASGASVRAASVPHDVTVKRSGNAGSGAAAPAGRHVAAPPGHRANAVVVQGGGANGSVLNVVAYPPTSSRATALQAKSAGENQQPRPRVLGAPGRPAGGEATPSDPENTGTRRLTQPTRGQVATPGVEEGPKPPSKAGIDTPSITRSGP